jgi:hypothetical protein
MKRCSYDDIQELKPLFGVENNFYQIGKDRLLQIPDWCVEQGPSKEELDKQNRINSLFKCKQEYYSEEDSLAEEDKNDGRNIHSLNKQRKYSQQNLSLKKNAKG